ncbi:MAG: methylenetetrahydrofolate reductase [NAD(P)H] [Lachnospiraceae bacterium]|nr:methylenetetrahydrofolate reductase [NAD(P)H] [Lachnospiraceae bacterium]
MNITQVFNQKKPVLSFEIFPPKKASALESIDETLAELCRLKPDFISVTFGAGGSTVDNKTIELGRKIKNDYSIEPLIHLTCLNYNKEEILEILRKLHKEELNNILALRGDESPDIKPKAEFKYASELVTFIKNHGDFSVSGACYPEKHLEAKDAVTDIHNLKMKVDAGAGHLISQLFFDNQVFYNFYEKTRIAGINVPISAGIMPVTNKKQVERMVSLCGASLPLKFKRILDRYENNPEALFDAGMAYAINQIVELIAAGVDGIHIYTMNKPIIARRICEGIKTLI